MPAIVVDSSVTCAWCFSDEQTDYTRTILNAVSDRFDAIVPRLWAYEVRNVVLMGLRRKRITQAAAEEFLQSLADLSFILTDPPSYDAVFALAARHGLTIYDAAYLDLAMREGVPIASLDSALIRAASQSGVGLFQP